MKKKTEIIGFILLAISMSLIGFLAVILFNIQNAFLFLSLLIIGSVSIASTATIYTVIQAKKEEERLSARAKSSPRPILKHKKELISAPKMKKVPSIDKTQIKVEVIEEYLNSLPYLATYLESNSSIDDIAAMKDVVFSKFSSDFLDKINYLGLSTTEKILFIHDMLTFTPDDRERLVESMLKNRGKTTIEGDYPSPEIMVEREILTEKLKVHVIPLVEPRKKMRTIDIEKIQTITKLKKFISKEFGYPLEDFLVSTGGIIMDEGANIEDYYIEEHDEIVLIPSRIPKKESNKK